ncbi:hypothetical protein LINPERPRIM_LOCUS40728, partial [Linum perenne]
ISSDNHEFRGTWFPSIVVRHNNENPNQYVVQYDKLFEDKSGKMALQKTLHWVQLRPAPPRIEKTNKSGKFKCSDEVKVPQRWLVGRRYHGGDRCREVRCLLPELQIVDRVWGEGVEDVVVSEPRKLVSSNPSEEKTKFSGIRAKKLVRW